MRLSGKDIALSIKEDIKNFIEERKSNGKRIPKVASILVGSDPGSIYYMNAQEKVALSLGLEFEKVIIQDDVEELEIIEKINELNRREDVDGMILQLPLPKAFNEKAIVSNICSEKDIDCLTNDNVGKLYLGDDGFIPCTPNSVLTCLKKSGVEIQGKEVVVVGRSNIVGKPVAQLLLNENATVTICHSRTKDLKEVCRRADILVVAIGKPKFITKDFLKKDVILIDVGTSSLNGKITGDVDYEDCFDTASMITPVPGGVGALTTTLLLKNACEALIKHEN